MQKHLSAITGKEVVVHTKKFTKKGTFRPSDKSSQPRHKEGPWFIEVAEEDLLKVQPLLSVAFSSKNEHHPLFSCYVLVPQQEFCFSLLKTKFVEMAITHQKAMEPRLVAVMVELIQFF